MKRITKYQRKELEIKLQELLYKHPRKYKGAQFHYGDLGFQVCLLKEGKYGYECIFRLMSFESMFNVLHYAAYNN